MRKALLSSLLLVMLLLSACGSKTTATPVTPTTAPTAATGVATPAGAKPGECQVAANPIFRPQPASAATYAPISAADHIEGPDTALITLIEYSDFT
jgi:hypothetical protein